MKFAPFLKGWRGAEKKPGLSTELEFSHMATNSKVTDLFQAGTVHWLNKCIERGKSETFSEVTMLTPGLAGELLRRNGGNRNVRPIKAEQYAADMAAGRWVLNGEPIIISKEGLLNDGQHRAQAVVESSTPIPCIIVFGVERDTRTTVDQGAARTSGDYLAMEGVENAALAAAISRMILAYSAAKGQSLSRSNRLTNAQVVARVKSDPAIGKAAHFASGHNRSPVTGSVVGFCHYIFSEVDEADAVAFLEQVTFGENLKRRDPAHSVRERILNIDCKSREAQIALLIRGWNFFRRNMQVAPSSLPATLPFPALI